MKLLTLENFRHGIGSVGDLPIPFETVLNVSALVIILTFVFLKVSWKESVLVAEETVLESNPSILGKLFGLIILLLIVLPGVVSEEVAKTSISPLILWVFLWIGVPVLGLFFGDVYSKFNPLNLLNNNSPKPSSVYMASVLFLGLTWFELVWRKPGNPFHIAIAFIILFSSVNILMYKFKKSSFEVDPLLLLHHLYSKLRIPYSKPVLKTMLSNLANLSRLPGMEYFILLMIGTVTYDGLRGTVVWYDRFGTQIYDTGFATVAFISINLLIISFYRFACYFALKVGKSKYSLNETSLAFGHTMLPIAFAYHVTHYISLLLFESQTLLYRLNDPIGLGWNLFGIEDITIIYFLSPVALWIIQVVVTLLGHMLSVVLAHDLSVKMFGHEQSDKTQYIFLFITVALTLQALFVLSVP
ncbi:hypothetical protein N9J00_02390 [Acidimicrobiia bacterium]|nr:hypothetical protein [Acidimicrobiia bacterium]MDC1071046.1 hypothetical protein [Acidimicrobiia bacterium]